MSVHIAGYEIDVFTDEVHNFDSMITSDPVETGSNTTDNIKQMPDVITLTGIVSDTPFGLTEDLRTQDEVASQTALDLLKAIRDLREPVTIETSLGTYKNMGMEKLSVPRNVGIGDSLQFSATFRQIRIVSTERTTVRVEVPRVGKKARQGNQSAPTSGEGAATPPPEDKPSANQSWFSQGVEAVAGAVS